MRKNTTSGLGRRTFLKQLGGVAALSAIPRSALPGSAEAAPSDKLNIACIGAGGRGGAQLNGIRGENLVALCDVDTRRAGGAFKRYSKVNKYRDFRTMFDKQEKEIDAVTVSTPDHTHAVAVMAAIKRNKHVYCEKPLAHSIYEIRALRKAAHEYNVVTQLGNQGHSFNTIRSFCEWIWDGAIGNVHTVHAACSAVHCRISELGRLKEKHDIPEELDWDLWLGPAAYRPYHPLYLPGSWRAWSPFGSGTIGDWICHVVDPSFWALDLGSPSSIQADIDEDYDPVKHADTFPAGSRITFVFPAKTGKKKRGPVTLHWYNGKRRIPHPDGLEKSKQPPRTGAVVLGDKGGIIHGSHGAGGVRLFPDDRMKAYKQPEKTLPRVRSHHHDWLQAVKTGKQAGSNFDYGGPLTELARLGIIAMHFPGRKLKWDGAKARFTDCDDANKLINPPRRKGWEL